MSLRIIVVMVLVFALLMLVAGGAVTLFDRLVKRRFQYTLRTLLMVVAVVAVIFSVIASWNKWFKAQLEFLDPTSPLVAKWETPPEILAENGDFKVVYRMRHCSARQIQGTLTVEMACGNIHGYRSDSAEGTIVIESSNREKLMETITAIQKVDVIAPGKFYLHGLVEDAVGNPVPKATIDLMGPYVYVNYFQTRDDGTFSMPMTAPAQSGYYLRIRYGKGDVMETTTFSLDSARPEMFVIVHVR